MKLTLTLENGQVIEYEGYDFASLAEAVARDADLLEDYQVVLICSENAARAAGHYCG